MKKSTITVPTLKYINGSALPGEICLASEASVTVLVNSIERYQFSCTPDHIKEMVFGRLLSDGLLCSASAVKDYICEYTPCFQKYSVRITIDTDNDCESECKSSAQWCVEWIQKLFGFMTEDTPTFRKTQSTHSCSLMQDGTILCCMEDISRHNALDKVLGWAILHNIALDRCIVFSSGRVPADMVQKAVRSGITVLAAKGLPTPEAISIATENGLTLIHCSKSNGVLQFTFPAKQTRS